MTEQQTVLDWLYSLSTDAQAQARSGNLAFLNKIAANSGIKHYFDNVFSLRAMSAEQWALWYVTQYHEALTAYEATLTAAETSALAGRMDAVEADITFIKSALETLLAQSASKRK